MAQNSTLQLGIFSIPVALHKVIDPKEVTFERAGASGGSIKREETEQVVEKATGEVTAVPVEREEIQYGVTDHMGEFHAIDQSEIDAIDEATKLDVFEIEAFVPLKDVPWERGLETYYLAPQSKAGPMGATPMNIIRTALLKEKVAGVMKIGLTKRQYLAVVYAKGKALYVQKLAWSEDWTRADHANVFEGVKADPKAVALAIDLIREYKAEDTQAALDNPRDDLRVLRARLKEQALADLPFAIEPKTKRSVAPSALLDQLEASLAQAKKPRAKARA